MGTSGGASTHIAASPERVYELISDVTRMGEWSPETVSCEWLDGATGPAVGARFRGKNAKGPARWSTSPTVEVADPGREFTFVTHVGRTRKGITKWRYTMTPSGDGTDVTESWEDVLDLPVLRSLMGSDRRVTELNAACATTLAQIKAAAES